MIAEAAGAAPTQGTVSLANSCLREAVEVTQAWPQLCSDLDPLRGSWGCIAAQLPAVLAWVVRCGTIGS
jgi:hypothetical protein